MIFSRRTIPDARCLIYLHGIPARARHSKARAGSVSPKETAYWTTACLILESLQSRILRAIRNGKRICSGVFRFFPTECARRVRFSNLMSRSRMKKLSLTGASVRWTRPDANRNPFTLEYSLLAPELLIETDADTFTLSRLAGSAACKRFASSCRRCSGTLRLRRRVL